MAICLEMLAGLDFVVRFPIQERYYACVYYLLLRVSQTNWKFPEYNMATKVAIFTYVFSGLSAGQ